MDPFGNGDSSMVGDRFTTYITRVFQPDIPEDEDGFHDASDMLHTIDEARESRPDGLGVVPDTGALAADRPRNAQGRSFAPVRARIGPDEQVDVKNDLLKMDPPGQINARGVINFTLGAGEVAIGVGFGAVTSWTGVGAVAGGAIALHGADVAQAAWRGTDPFTSQGLQAVGLSQNTANAISTGITGAAYIAAGAQILPYSLVGSPLAGGTGGTSLLSMTARGYVIEGLKVGNESSTAVFDALQTLTRTGTNAAAVGRAASFASGALGHGLEGAAAIQGGVIGQAQGAESNTSQGVEK
jgi:hypothetical protein